MRKPIAKIAIAGVLLASAAMILLTQAGRGDGTQPTARVEAGAFPSHRAPDEPVHGGLGLPQGVAR